MLSPIISILRPVSPLAWLPIGLLVLQKAEPASIWVMGKTPNTPSAR